MTSFFERVNTIFESAIKEPGSTGGEVFPVAFRALVTSHLCHRLGKEHGLVASPTDPTARTDFLELLNVREGVVRSLADALKSELQAFNQRVLPALIVNANGVFVNTARPRRDFKGKICGMRDSNPQHPACKADALPLS
jgi:hypothetical protein